MTTKSVTAPNMNRSSRFDTAPRKLETRGGKKQRSGSPGCVEERDGRSGERQDYPLTLALGEPEGAPPVGVPHEPQGTGPDCVAARGPGHLTEWEQQPGKRLRRLIDHDHGCCDPCRSRGERPHGAW